MTRLAVLTSHPIQYYAPLFRELARQVDLHVFFAHRQTDEQQAAAGFGAAFAWDVDLTSGYANSFLRNVASQPSVSRFSGSDTPEVGRRLAEGRFDAVLTLGWHLKALLQGSYSAKRLSLPVLVRGDSQLGGPRGLPKRVIKRLVYPPFLRLFDVALYVGERSRQYYEHYRYPADRLIFSPHCVDTRWFAERADPQAGRDLRIHLGVAPLTRLVLFAGKLVPFKRPLDVAAACARLRNMGQDVELLVAGSGELEGELRAQAASLGLPAHLLGFQNQTAMPAAYAAADVLALPSTGRETWGLVVNEAVACGRPVVVSNEVGCAPDLAADQIVGRTFAMGDISAFADALASTLGEPPARERIAALSARYSLEAAATGILQGVERARHRSGRRL